jgi:hypothetical protein
MEIWFYTYLLVLAFVIIGTSVYAICEYADGNKSGAKFAARLFFASPLWPVVLLGALIWIGFVEPLRTIHHSNEVLKRSKK